MNDQRRPNFFLIGAAKAGTTSLYYALRQHPQVFLSPIKEPSYFSGQPIINGPTYLNRDQTHVKDRVRYAALFAESDGYPVVGDFSTSYLALSDVAAPAIAAECPDARLAAVLRDPAERAFSHFVMHRQLLMEPEKRFEAALDDEPRRIANSWEWALCYSATSQYARQLTPYLERFPRRQIGIYDYEDWKNNPETFLRTLFEFLEIDPDFQPDTRRRYQLGVLPRWRAAEQFIKVANPFTFPLRRILAARTRDALRQRALRWNSYKPEMSPAERAHMIALCRDDILELQELLGRDYSTWLE
ncbi:MAG: sulfotransferase [Chloroflexi bacterium]|nr:sulfotransferase [Chloroflexota bacterium]